ncbi:MAG: hypothetical protein AAB360_00965 [Patescibacteria group bacterium]
MAETKEKNKTKPIGSRPVFSWESPEYVHYTKGAGWFVAVGAVALAIAGLLYWQGLASGAIVAVAAGAVFMIISKVKPKPLRLAVYPDGVVVGDRVYRYGQFKSFGIIRGEIAKAKLDLVGRFSGEVVLPLKNIDPEQIRLYLKKHLPENEDINEDLSDIVNRLFKF